MMNPRISAIAFSWIVLSIPLICAQDLSKYREFQLGMNLPAVAKEAGINPSEARVIHQRPAMIQVLEWWPQHSYLLPADPVKEILFSFYNGELFRMVISYDSGRTAGLTADDMIEAISAKYGTATKPAATILVYGSSQAYSDKEKVIARWDDSQYSLNLFSPSTYQSAFGMVVFSKGQDALAQAAIVKAMQLEQDEAPQREVERQKKQDEENRAAGQKARAANKANFRP